MWRKGLTSWGFTSGNSGKKGNCWASHKKKRCSNIYEQPDLTWTHISKPLQGRSLGNSTPSYEDGRIITGTVQPNMSSKRSDMPNGRCSGSGRNADTREKEVNGWKSATFGTTAIGHSGKGRQNWSSPTQPRSHASPRSQGRTPPMTQLCANTGRSAGSDKWEGKPTRNNGWYCTKGRDINALCVTSRLLWVKA